MTIRVLGIDPGLTRCGIGIVDVEPNRRATLVDVSVIRTLPDMPLEQRLLAVGSGIDDLIERWKPDAVSLERVFAQHNLRTVMGTAQASGVALHAAAKRGLAVGLHTPSEVKAAITGYGSADKKQVQVMVAHVLGLSELPRPADAADALAIAICHAWNPGSPASATASNSTAAPKGTSPSNAQTPAQMAWLAAERRASKSVPKRRLAP